MLIGIAVWLLSVAGESIADRQLARFRADPPTRAHLPHRLALLAPPQLFLRMAALVRLRRLAVGSPLAWLAWSGPAPMYVFLRWISGIPLRRGAGAAQPR